MAEGTADQPVQEAGDGIGEKTQDDRSDGRGTQYPVPLDQEE